ncbi:hypothetical protein BJ165DRAFT_1518758 [Panaeolus papilionaceus]|nr:hypothetical protein BJ165DRAFT_1518758 [Panaeolus papilionaceus]
MMKRAVLGVPSWGAMFRRLHGIMIADCQCYVSARGSGTVILQRFQVIEDPTELRARRKGGQKNLLQVLCPPRSINTRTPSYRIKSIDYPCTSLET